LSQLIVIRVTAAIEFYIICYADRATDGQIGGCRLVTKTPSPEQIRAARGMLDWSILDLANAARVSVSTVPRVEAGGQVPASERSLAKIQCALEGAGVHFLANDGDGYGLRLKKR
jgi:hypothetical protein